MSAPSGNHNNKLQWNAMDLHSASGSSSSSSNARFPQQQTHSSGYNTRSAAAAANAMRVDESGLSARNILIRRKLMERKRFDSADHAMKANSDANAAPATDSGTSNPPRYYTSTPSPAATTFSPAHVGASVLYSALGAGSGDNDDNVDMDTEGDAVSPATTDAVTAAATAAAPSSNSYLTQSTAAAARSASRYGNLSGPAGGAASARSILLQKKLREKKHFDSADYQLAQLQPHASTAAASATISPAPDTVCASEGSSATPMEIDLTPVTVTAAATVASINSPSAASLAASRSRMNAQMSPSVRGGKYGSAQSGANVLLMRKLSEKKRFDSTDYHMEAAPVAAHASGPQRFFVSSASSSATPASSLPAPPSTGDAAAPVPAPTVAAPSSSSGASKYGKLSAVNVLIRKKLKERKRFDSADYAMERQGRCQAAAGAQNNNTQGGATGAFQNGHVVMNRTGSTAAAADAAAALEDNKSISHQVKHIKLSDGVGGWAAATRVPAGSPDGSAGAATGAAASKASAMSQDSRLVARNLIIQRKLSERKRFDSADYFKEAASRSRR